jgi:hypothetical protein
MATGRWSARWRVGDRDEGAVGELEGGGRGGRIGEKRGGSRVLEEGRVEGEGLHMDMFVICLI